MTLETAREREQTALENLMKRLLALGTTTLTIGETELVIKQREAGLVELYLRIPGQESPVEIIQLSASADRVHWFSLVLEVKSQVTDPNLRVLHLKHFASSDRIRAQEETKELRRLTERWTQLSHFVQTHHTRTHHTP